MFNIGDKVFYPMHGAGTIESIEDMEVFGKSREYYVINIPISNMDVKIPCDNVEKLKIRSTVDRDKLNALLQNHSNVKTPNVSREWSERVKSYSEKMKQGEIEATIDIVRSLLLLSKEKSLNSTERDLLNNARKLLISELTVIKGISETQALELLEETS